MQEIDQQKLSEFTNELSEFQIEASKTASIDVYDRFTISKLEDHLVDLCQLSIDASHEGLQYLCERLRDNIRDHFITGTNISDVEFSLMAEWKSLVKVYLVNNDNENVVNALAANLSKSGWTYPLNSNDTEEVISVLLNRSLNANSSDDAFKVDDSDEFDSLLGESNTSLADVFESLNDEGEAVEDVAVNLPDEKEHSIAEFFEDDSSNTSDRKVDKSSSDFKVKQTEISSDQEQSSEGELPEIDEVVAQTLPNDKLDTKAAFADSTEAPIEKIEVSEEELEEIDQAVVDSVVDELHVDEEVGDHVDENAVDTKAAFADSDEAPVDKIEVSEQELEEIDQAVVDSVVDELHVDEEVGDHVDENAVDTKAAFADSDEAPVDKIEVSEQELEEIDQAVVDSVVDELHVDEEVGDHVDENAVDTKAAFADSDEALVDKIEVSEQELEEIDQAVVDSVVDELHVDEEVNDDLDG